MTGANSLNNFYQSVKFENPTLAEMMGDDIVTVALYGLSADKTPAQPAAERLRRQAFEFDLPEIQRRVLDNALTEMGYS